MSSTNDEVYYPLSRYLVLIDLRTQRGPCWPFEESIILSDWAQMEEVHVRIFRRIEANSYRSNPLS